MKKLIYLIPILVLIFYIGKYFYMKPRFKSGDKILDFSAVLSNGDRFNSEALRGKYVLIDFWGSWCGPCRADNAKLVNLNKQFSGKTFKDAVGFEIVSIGVERNKIGWEKAIIQDNLTWKHQILQTDRFNSPITVLYGVRQIPTKFLLNAEGKVVFTNPSFDKIYEFLNSNLVSK